MSISPKPEIQEAIDRWKVEIEIDPIGNSGKSVAIYGYLPTGMRILLGMMQEERRMRYVDEVIDEYLREADPVLAAALLQDVDTLLAALDEIENYRFGPYGDKD
jgi:hypothetical protein